MIQGYDLTCSKTAGLRIASTWFWAWQWSALRITDYDSSCTTASSARRSDEHTCQQRRSAPFKTEFLPLSGCQATYFDWRSLTCHFVSYPNADLIPTCFKRAVTRPDPANTASSMNTTLNQKDEEHIMTKYPLQTKQNKYFIVQGGHSSN